MKKGKLQVDSEFTLDKGAVPVITLKGPLSEEKLKNLRDQLEKLMAGDQECVVIDTFATLSTLERK